MIKDEIVLQIKSRGFAMKIFCILMASVVLGNSGVYSQPCRLADFLKKKFQIKKEGLNQTKMQ